MAETIDLHAFGYLIKPVRNDEFTRLFGQALQECEKKASDKQEVILIKIGSVSRTVITDEILYVESAKRKNIIHLKDEQIEYS